MNIISSSDHRYHEKLEHARAFFGKEIVSRQEILEYQNKTGTQMPSKFWNSSRVARGMFSLNKQETAHKEPGEVVALRPQMIHKEKPSAIISKFEYDAMIPSVKDTFVEWGNFKTIETLIKSKQFFTLYVTGDSGSGKNEMISQVCAKLKKPMVRVSITRETKEEHLIGSKTLVDGSIVYEEGPVKWAAENGALLILDEISLADPAEIMCLQAILEGESFFVKAANQQVTPKEGFCVIATDNTKGRGSDSGRYIGTNILNDAFLERFEMTMEQGYPNEKTERKIIEKLMANIGMDDTPFLEKLVQWVHAIRKVYIEEGLEEQITTRRACHIVKTYAKLKNAETAIELCVNRFDETTKLAMISLWEKLTVAPVQVPEEQMEPEHAAESN
jgi:AAA domain (dynein-related subfamily)